MSMTGDLMQNLPMVEDDPALDLAMAGGDITMARNMTDRMDKIRGEMMDKTMKGEMVGEMKAEVVDETTEEMRGLTMDDMLDDRAAGDISQGTPAIEASTAPAPPARCGSGRSQDPAPGWNRARPSRRSGRLVPGRHRPFIASQASGRKAGETVVRATGDRRPNFMVAKADSPAGEMVMPGDLMLDLPKMKGGLTLDETGAISADPMPGKMMMTPDSPMGKGDVTLGQTKGTAADFLTGEMMTTGDLRWALMTRGDGLMMDQTSETVDDSLTDEVTVMTDELVQDLMMMRGDVTVDKTSRTVRELLKGEAATDDLTRVLVLSTGNVKVGETNGATCDSPTDMKMMTDNLKLDLTTVKGDITMDRSSASVGDLPTDETMMTTGNLRLDPGGWPATTSALWNFMVQQLNQKKMKAPTVE